MRPHLVISCPASSRSGYGDHSRDLIKSLIKMDKFNIEVLDQMWGHCPQDALPEGDEIRNLFVMNINKQPDIWIQVTVPNEFRPIGKYNIGITAGIETTLCSPEWLQGCNQMHKVIVPSEHSKYVLTTTNFDKKKQGSDAIIEKLQLTTDVEVLFEGLDLEVFGKKHKIPSSIDETLNSIKEDFCFLICGHWLNGVQGEDRKDIGNTIKVFCETFKNKSQKNMPALVCKISSATFSIDDRESMRARIDTIKQQVGDKIPNIYLLHGDLSPEEMNGLYNHKKIKAMVSFTKGEGFGRPLLEFSNTGKPVIASNWSGHVDFLSAYGIMLPGKLNNVHESVVWEKTILKESQWFTVDYGYASSVMSDVHKNYKRHLEKSRKQTQYVKENFTLDLMKNKFQDIMQDILEWTESIEKPKLTELAELKTYE
jgi:glycosyltransferase involved in cell wall biosynthesis